MNRQSYYRNYMRMRRQDPMYRTAENKRRNKRNHEHYAQVLKRDNLARRRRLQNPVARKAESKRALKRHHERMHSDPAYRKTQLEGRRKWQAAHPLHMRAIKHRRRARLAGNGGSYTPIQWLALVAKYNHRCLSCGKRRKLSVDHVAAVKKGGTSNIDNLQPLCQPCNASKGTQRIDYRLRPHPNCRREA